MEAPATTSIHIRRKLPLAVGGVSVAGAGISGHVLITGCEDGEAEGAIKPSKVGAGDDVGASVGKSGSSTLSKTSMTRQGELTSWKSYSHILYITLQDHHVP